MQGFMKLREERWGSSENSSSFAGVYEVEGRGGRVRNQGSLAGVYEVEGREVGEQ